MYVNTPHLHLLQYSVKKIVSKKIASVVCVGDWCDLNITIFCFCWTLWSSGVQLGNLWLDTDYHYIHFLLSCIDQQASECTDSGQDQEFGNTSIDLHPPNIGLIFKTMWKFPHDSPSDFIQTKIVPTSTTNKLDLTIRATSSRYKGLFNNVHQWHQSPISVTDVHHLYFWKILCIPTLWTYEVACREVTKCHKVTSFPIFKPLHENRS